MVGIKYVIVKIIAVTYYYDMPKLCHYDDLGTARFITFSCYRRHKYLSDENSILILLDQLRKLRFDCAINILGYVIMPDHVHLVLYPTNVTKLGVLIGQLKGRSAHAIIGSRKDIYKRSNGQPAVWQRRCFDHNCRTPEIVIEKIQYCHNNPVKKGLVDTPDEWPWSSYGWYNGDKNALLEIDGIEL